MGRISRCSHFVLIIIPKNLVKSTIFVLDFIVFLAAGISLRATLAASSGLMTGVTQQIATGDGTLVQPGGYPL